MDGYLSLVPISTIILIGSNILESLFQTVGELLEGPDRKMVLLNLNPSAR
jgi:hypothetical protein